MRNPKITDWSGKRVWLVGASTGIGAALAHALAKSGARLALSARSGDKLMDLNIAGALLVPCDATDPHALAKAYNTVKAAFNCVDVVIYLAGNYQPMRAENFDLNAAENILAVNYVGAMRLAAIVLPDLQPRGGIAFVASVAGYRGLPKSIAYGPGKAALIHFAECLQFDLLPKNIGVWLINPGFVATELTSSNDFEMPALISPGQAAKDIIDGMGSGCFEIHFPKRFTRVMKLLSLLPYRLYFRLIRRITGG